MAIRDNARRRPLRLNFSALLALSVLCAIWIFLVPVWSPAVDSLLSLVEGAFLFVAAIILALSAVLLFGFALAAGMLLLGGTIPKSL
jgi:polyferredoxin